MPDQKRSSQKKMNFRRKNKDTQKKYNKKRGGDKKGGDKKGGGFWELFGFAPDSLAVKQLKDQKKVCDTEAKTSIDKTNADIKVAEEAIATAKKGIEEIKKTQKMCNAELDKKIDAQINREKAEELLKKSEQQGQPVAKPMISQSTMPIQPSIPMMQPQNMDKDMDTMDSLRPPPPQRPIYVGQGGRSRNKRSKK